MRFVFDTSVLIDYLRDPNDIAADALVIAAERGQAFVSWISLMELYLPQRSNLDVQAEVTAIQELCTHLNIRIIPASDASQRRALEILRNHRSRLGRNALTDSLILGTGITRRAYLVTRDAQWFQISKRVISPEGLLQRFWNV